MIYPGSFDPITFGHIDLIKRALTFCDELVVLVANNENKKYLFSLEERVDLVREALKNFSNVKVDSTSGLTIKYALANNIITLLRGIRNINDFKLEFDLFYKSLEISKNEVDVVYLFCHKKDKNISSSKAKELALKNKDITKYVPECVIQPLMKKLKNLVQK